MASKLKMKNKKKQAPLNKEANCTVKWPDLPQKLVDVIAKQPALMQRISYGGLTKLCRSTTSKCNQNKSPPCLQLFDEINSGKNDNDYVEPNLNASFYRRWLWYWYHSMWARPPVRSHWKHYVGYSNDAIVAKGDMFSSPRSPDRIYLWHPVDGYSNYPLPEWDEKVPLMRAVTSSSARKFIKKNCYVMVLTGTSHPAFLFCRLGERKMEWVKQDCSMVESQSSLKSEGKNFMTFTNAIGFNGRFYVLSLQGTLAVIDASESESYPRITALSSERAVPTALPKYFREYLLESEGNILLVFLISRKSIKVVDDVEVFQLNTAKLSWVKMESLGGDRTLFLGTNCCMSVSGSKVGCRSNCVYFTIDAADSWWVFDMEMGCISLSSSDATTKSPDWTEPIQE